MKQKWFVLLITFLYIGSCCKAQELKPVKGVNGKYGYLDDTGKEIVPFQYDYAGSFVEGLAKVEWDSHWGFINQTGKIVVPFKYDYAISFSEGLACVLLNSHWGFVNKTGKEIIPVKYDGAGDFSEGLAAVKLNDKWGFIDQTGEMVVPVAYTMVGNFTQGKARVERETDAVSRGAGGGNRGARCQYNYINKEGVLLDQWKE
jgi:hypothetical protein